MMDAKDFKRMVLKELGDYVDALQLTSILLSHKPCMSLNIKDAVGPYLEGAASALCIASELISDLDDED